MDQPKGLSRWKGCTVNHPEIPNQLDADYNSSSDVFIALMGVTGSGKSSFISLCSQKAAKVGHDLRACRLRLPFPLTRHTLSKS